MDKKFTALYCKFYDVVVISDTDLFQMISLMEKLMNNSQTTCCGNGFEIPVIKFEIRVYNCILKEIAEFIIEINIMSLSFHEFFLVSFQKANAFKFIVSHHEHH